MYTAYVEWLSSSGGRVNGSRLIYDTWEHQSADAT